MSSDTITVDRAEYDELVREHTRMWNRLVLIASKASGPMNGHTAGNVIGYARNEITLIERDRARRLS